MLKRLKDLEKKQRDKLSMRMKNGTLNKHIDEDGYLCYDDQELMKWKSKKVGRKIKKQQNIIDKSLINS